MAGSERIMSKESLLMIHNAWMFTAGNADQLRKDADDLEKISETMSNAYLEGTNISKDKLKTLLADETWIPADEAKEYGFATKVTGDDDSDNPKMSAMSSVKARLTSKSQPAERSVDEIAEAISEKLAKLVEGKVEEKPTEDHEKGPEEDPNGWNKFFS